MASAKLKQLQKKHGITGEYRGTSKGIVHAVKGGTEQKKTSAPPIHEEEYDGRVKGNKTKEQLISEHKRNTASSAVKNAVYREDYDVLKTDFTKKRDDALSGLNDISINPAKYGKAGAKLASVYQSDLDFYESKIKEVEKASRYAPGQGASKIMTEEEWNKRKSPIEKRWSYQDYLDAQNYLAQPVTLTVNDNGVQKNLGNLSRGAYKAIEENKLDSYVIKTAEEGKTIAEYEKFVEKQIKKQQEEYAKKQAEWDKKNGGSKDSWFKSGGFSEGVDGVGDFFRDLGQTAAGTVGDLGLGVIKGVGRLAEGLIDLGTYGVAGVADLFGAEKFAEKTKDIAKYSATDEWTKGATDFVDKHSVLGNKSDGIAEGIGQVAGIIGTAGLGAAAGLGGAGTAALTTGTMGLSSMGTNIGEAYKSGATDGEAFVYGLGAGAIEAGTELLFGGLGKGVKTLGISRGIGGLDDIFAKKLSSKIAGSFANESVQRALGNTVEFGVKSAGEGFEEVLSGVGSAVMKKLTYMTDEELTKLLKDENLLNQFIVGTVTSSIMQSPDYIKANKTGTDFVTGQTSEQERVIDAVAEYEVAKREESGEKLTNREKNKIYDDVTNVVSRASVDPLEQAAREVVARRNKAEARPSDEVTAQSLERLTQNNAPITSEEVKKVTGFGDRGSELVAKTANVEGATFYEVMAEVKPSYTAGFNNPDLDIKKVAHTFDSQAQEDAYTAGQKDAIMQNAVAKENAKSATVYDGNSGNTVEAETAISPEEAQRYNIMVSNLKRKAENMGLLDDSFFTKLQNVNLYNPTASDRALIASEFSRVFADNTDPLVTSWLDGIGIDTQPTTSVSEGVESGIESDKYVTRTPESVIKPTESVIKKADSVTETVESEKNTPEAERYDIPEDSETVDNIVVDEHSKRLKRENPRAYSNIIRMAKRLGMNVRFVKNLTDENGNVLEGLITSKGIFINADAKNPSRFVATHEFGHRMKQAAPEVWAAYQEYVINKLKKESYDNGMTAYDILYEETKNAYEKNDPDSINEEIAVNYAGELFDSEEMLESFIREDKSLALRVRDWWYKVLESMGLLSEKKKAQQLWLRAYTAAGKNVKEGKVGEFSGEKFKYVGETDDGRKIYRTNYKEGTPKSVKQNDLIDIIQNIWSKKPIHLTIKENGVYKEISANFNPELSERSDLSKIVFGNRKGSGSEKRMTLDLSTDLYQIASDAKQTGSKAETGKDNKAHDGVKHWYYFITNLVYEDVNGEHIDCYMNIDVKENQSGHYFYSFAIEKGTAPQTLLAVVSDEMSPTVPTDTTISQDNPSVNSHSMQNTEENAQGGKKSIPGTRLSELVEKYGLIQSGENPHRDVQVPRKTEKNKKVSQTVRTILEAKATPDEAVPTIERMVEDGIFSYEAYTDKKAIENGEEGTVWGRGSFCYNFNKTEKTLAIFTAK